jgi:hypothetical protein
MTIIYARYSYLSCCSKFKLDFVLTEEERG